MSGPGRLASAAAAAGAALALAGCAPAGGAEGDGGAAPAVVAFSAASSLTDVAPRLAAAYAEGPGDGAAVRTNLGSSATLVQQANAGQAPDVLVPADPEAADALADPARYEDLGDAAVNRLVLAVPAGSPLDSPRALGPSHTVAVCAPEVPCGRSAHAWLEATGTALGTASAEDNVRAVLTKVAAGQVDAGFVYATDAAAAGDAVRALPLPAAEPNAYPVLVARDAPPAARGFARWLLGPEAGRILRDAGFGRP